MPVLALWCFFFWWLWICLHIVEASPYWCALYVSSFCYVCALLLSYMCSHTTVEMSSCYCAYTHTHILYTHTQLQFCEDYGNLNKSLLPLLYVSSYYDICVHLLLYRCGVLILLCVSSYYFMCPHTLLPLLYVSRELRQLHQQANNSSNKPLCRTN